MCRVIAICGLLITVACAGCDKQHKPAHSTSTTPTSTASPSTTSPTSSTSTPQTPSVQTTTSETATPSLLAKSNEICAEAYAGYKVYEGSSSEPSPLELQIKTDSELSKAAHKLTEAGADELAEALESQVESGKELARAEIRGQLDMTPQFKTYEEAGEKTTALARDLGASECERLGGI